MEGFRMYRAWAYGPSESVYLVHKSCHLFVCGRIDSSDEAHYGRGTWCNIGNAWSGNVAAVLNTEAEVLAVERGAPND